MHADTGHTDHVLRRRPGAAVDREVAALVASAGAHVLRLVDVGGAPDGDLLLVVERLPHALPALLAVAGWPTPGEAVTALAPIAQAVASLGARGIVHGGVGAAAIRFDDEGRPVLTGFEHAVVASAAGDRSVDAAALRDLVCGVLRRTGASGESLADRVQRQRPGAAVLADLLFGLAEPEPVRLHPAAPSPRWEPAGRLVAVQPAPDAAVPSGATSDPASRWAARRRIGTVLRSVRPRVWGVAAGSVALLGAALVLLPAHADRSAADGTPPTALVSASARAAPRASPSPRASLGPLDAVSALLDARNDCLRRGSESCLAGIDAAGSPVLADDRAATHGGQAAVRVSTAALGLVQASGTTALFTAGGTTVLAVREPLGWRLRDVVASR